ncbi:MAG: protein translocase subunit SecD [Chloroflexi bacterium]|nr:protein translocase subunit SecD [Chloroflexota bacterium]
MSWNTRVLLGIILLTAFALWVLLPPQSTRFGRQGMRLGLDLKGGTHIVLEADLSKLTPDEAKGAVEGVKRVIERRINTYGVTEPVIQRQGANRISIQLPGVKDVKEAVRLVGETAQLDFREMVVKEDGSADWVVAKAIGSDGQEKELTGRYFRPNAHVVFDPQTGQPRLAFEFNSEGAKLFKQVTERNVGKPLGIFLDNQLLTAPTVKSVIENQGVIENIGLEEARLLAIQLNAGALPVPVSIVQQEDVDATLGADSLRKSLLAGEIGLGIVFLFMVLYYRLPGFLASCALLVYTALVLSIFKLIPVTLTLAGIAAFILSIGMAVDANILIFERMKEEARRGKTLRASIEAGFSRAWTAIRDSNVSTFITCAILYWFGRQFGASLVMGFALTLGIGVAVSMFSALMVTRTFLRLVLATSAGRRWWLFAVER